MSAYILIYVFAFYTGSAPTSTGTAEFKTLSACQAAASAMKRQAALARGEFPVLVCAAK